MASQRYSCCGTACFTPSHGYRRYQSIRQGRAPTKVNAGHGKAGLYAPPPEDFAGVGYAADQDGFVVHQAKTLSGDQKYGPPTLVANPDPLCRNKGATMGST